MMAVMEVGGREGRVCPSFLKQEGGRGWEGQLGPSLSVVCVCTDNGSQL